MGNRSKVVTCAFFLLLGLGLHVYAAPRPMRVLAMGEVDTAYCPLAAFFASEPSLDVTLAVARDMHGTVYGENGLRRIIRLYVPRDLKTFLEYKFIIINQPVIRLFPERSLEEMRSAIADHGVGGLCFMESMYGDIYMPWLQTELSKCFPYDHYANLKLGAPGGRNYNLEVVKDKDLPPLLTAFVPLGIEKVSPFGEARPTFPKEGATAWAYCKVLGMPFGGVVNRFPLFISWVYGPGKAMVWTTADQFDSPMWKTHDGKERFQVDILAGMIWLSSGWGLPDDPVMVHNLRNSFSQLSERRELLYNVLDFIDDFGANTRAIEKEIDQLRGMTKEAGDLYLDHEFEESRATVKDAFDLAAEIEGEAVQLKERALLWVHLIEWLTVTSTMILTGVVIWSLMVRRRLYHAVATTRGVG